MSNPTDPSLYAMQQATLAAAERTAAALERIADTMEGKAEVEPERHRTTMHHIKSDDTYQIYCECGVRSPWGFLTFDDAQRFVKQHQSGRS